MVDSSETLIRFYYASVVVVIMANCRLYACMKSNEVKFSVCTL